MHSWNWWYLIVPALFGLGIYLATQKCAGKKSYGEEMKFVHAILSSAVFGFLLVVESGRGIIEFGYQHGEAIISACLVAVACVVVYGLVLYWTMEYFETHYYSRSQKCMVRKVAATDAYVTAILAIARDEDRRERQRQAEAQAEARRQQEILQAKKAAAEAARHARTKARRDVEILCQELEHPGCVPEVAADDWMNQLDVTVRLPQANGMTQMLTMPLSDLYSLTQNILRWNRQQYELFGDAGYIVELPRRGDEIEEEGFYQLQSEQPATCEPVKSRPEPKLEINLTNISGEDKLKAAATIRAYLKEHPEIKAIARQKDSVVRLDIDPNTNTVRVHIKKTHSA